MSIDIEYSRLPSGEVCEKELEECSRLYSNHYGLRSKNAPSLPQKQIKLSASKIRLWLNNNATLYLAKLKGDLVGYAIAITITEENHGQVSWVTQLVIHEDYRKQNIAKTLLFSIWGLSNYYAWGILTANPYAVRALEKATRRRCNPERIFRDKETLFKIGYNNLPYVESNTEIDVSRTISKINTKFFVDHSLAEEMIEKATAKTAPWLLGRIEEGWEWFAFTFKDQNQMELTKEELDKMIGASDQMAKQAYSRMTLDGKHKWLSHTKSEVDFITNTCGLTAGQNVLDLGCGTGRHSLELARREINPTCIDYIPEFIERVKISSREEQLCSVRSIVSDCREMNIEQNYDAVICLYDVVGSFVNDKENIKILENITRSLKPGGFAIISVMNYELTRHNAKHLFSFSEHPNKLLNLPSTSIMEKTGDIFDPEYYILDEQTHIIYRKEQFFCGKELSTELIVRDKRYTKNEITNLCEEAGLRVQWARYVGSGKWNKPMKPTDSSAKEILVLCQKTEIETLKP